MEIGNPLRLALIIGANIFGQKGYCVSTIGLDEEQIRKYARYQLHKDKIMEQSKR